MQRHDPRWWVWETTAAASAELVEMAEEAGDGNQGTDLQGLVSSQWSLSQDDNLHADLHTLCMFSFKINVPFFQYPPRGPSLSWKAPLFPLQSQQLPPPPG